MHPNEIPVVFVGDKGRQLPTRELIALMFEVRKAGAPFRNALAAQVQRQKSALSA
jgi:hypothetical protein